MWNSIWYFPCNFLKNHQSTLHTWNHRHFCGGGIIIWLSWSWELRHQEVEWFSQQVRGETFPGLPGELPRLCLSSNEGCSDDPRENLGNWGDDLSAQGFLKAISHVWKWNLMVRIHCSWAQITEADTDSFLKWKDGGIGPVFKLLIFLLIMGLVNNYLVMTVAERDCLK